MTFTLIHSTVKMANRKILLRFDDVCSTMDWKQWDMAMQLIDEINATALIGIIPDCQDPSLQIDTPRNDFWEYIKQLQDKGFSLAMHGFNHVFSTKANGIVTKNKISEFAGLPYEVQLEKVRQGKDILNAHGIDTDVFFAPAHSYDDNTLRALAECGFHYISDGFSSRPYHRQGIICIPCPNGGIPKIKRKGYYTAVIHAHEWSRSDKSHDWALLQNLCRKHKEEIVGFNEFIKWKVGYTPIQRAVEKIMLFNMRYIIPILVKIKHTILRN